MKIFFFPQFLFKKFVSGLGVSAMALACAGRHLAVVRTLKSLNVAVDPKPSVRLHQIAPTPYMVFKFFFFNFN